MCIGRRKRAGDSDVILEIPRRDVAVAPTYPRLLGARRCHGRILRYGYFSAIIGKVHATTCLAETTKCHESIRDIENRASREKTRETAEEPLLSSASPLFKMPGAPEKRDEKLAN